MAIRFGPRATRLVLRHRGAVMALAVILLGVGSYGASHLEMRLNYLELLPQEDPSVVDLHWMQSKAGTEGYLVSAIAGGTREQRLALGDRWTKVLEQRPELRWVEFRSDPAFFRQNAAWMLPLSTLEELAAKLKEAVKREVQRSIGLDLDDGPARSSSTAAELERLVQSYEAKLPAAVLEDEAKTEVFVLAKPAFESSDLARAGALLASLREAADRLLETPEHAGLRVDFGGPMVLQKAFDQGIRGDLARMSIWSLVLSTLVLLMATRRPLAVLVVLAPILVAISCTLALAAIFVGHLTVISGILVAVLLGLGVEFGLHLVLRTREAGEGRSLLEALEIAAPETMEGAFSGAVTNASAFLVLLGCTFRAFREFGAIAAGGVILSWLMSYALLPPMIAALEARLPGWVIPKASAPSLPWSVPRPLVWIIVVLVPVLGLFGGAFARDIRFERSFTALYDETPDPVGTRAATAAGGSLTPAVFWAPSAQAAKALEGIIAELRAEEPRSMLGNTLCIADLVPDDRAARLPVLESIRAQLERIPEATRAQNQARIDEVERMLDAPPLGLDQLPLEVRRRFQPLDGEGSLLLLVPARSVDASDELEAFVIAVESVIDRAAQRGIPTHALSENRIAVRIFREVFADAPFIAWVSTLVVLLTLFFLIRTLRGTLVVFVPIALGILLMLLGIEVSQLKLNFINIAVIPSIFTIAIDNAVHLYHRYREEGRAAMPAVLRHTGLAVLMATLINGTGYAPALTAAFFGLRSLGWVASFGLLGMLLSTVVWFPGLLFLLPDLSRRARSSHRSRWTRPSPRGSR
ncbi:MAG: MMPL family transporter [Myxococcota bacterium]